MITPLRDMVLVQLADDVAPPTASGIVVQRLARQPSTHATVLACGPEVVDATPGVAVVISRLQGIEVGTGLLLLPESAILATQPQPEDDDSFGNHLTGGVDNDV